MAVSLSHSNKLFLEGVTPHSLPFPSLLTLPHGGNYVVYLTHRKGTKEPYINVLIYTRLY